MSNRVSPSGDEAHCDQLYYDGKCPLCVKEMEKLALHKSDTLELVDIHHLPPEGVNLTSGNVKTDIIDQNTLLRTLHYRTAQGNWLKGIDANVAAWQSTRFAWVWRLFTLPVIRTVVGLVYNRWAKWRYRRLYGDP